MKIDMVMPQMGESIVEGTVVEWRKKQGELVEQDEIILEISTDKVDSEIPSPRSGVLSEILINEGETVQVGTVIARIESSPTNTGESLKSESILEIQPVEEMLATEDVKAPEAGRTFLSPVVKKIALENDISLDKVEQIKGTGAGGRITKKDILAYLEKEKVSAMEEPLLPKEEPPRAEKAAQKTHAGGTDRKVTIIPMDHVRRKIAENMIRSKQISAHVTSVIEADVTNVVQNRERLKEEFEVRQGIKLTFTAFFVQIVAQVLKQFPLLNSSVEGEQIIQKNYINIGIAVGMNEGLVVPVIKNADHLSLLGIAMALNDLTERARNRRLKPEDVQDGTFSITNLGTFGNLFGTPIIPQPQVAILGTGVINKKPVVIQDAIAIRSMMYLSLTFDHRIIDGLYGGSFLLNLSQMIAAYKSDAF